MKTCTLLAIPCHTVAYPCLIAENWTQWAGLGQFPFWLLQYLLIKIKAQITGCFMAIYKIHMQYYHIGKHIFILCKGYGRQRLFNDTLSDTFYITTFLDIYPCRMLMQLCTICLKLKNSLKQYSPSVFATEELSKPHGSCSCWILTKQ